MDEIEMQQRPLLDDNASSPSFPLASRKPLDLNAPRSSSKTKRPAMSPARFCLGFCSFLALVISGAFVYTIYGLVGAVANPHGSHHANATLVAASESKAELVRPFFDPDGRGRLESFDLGVMVHARWDDLPETEALTEEKAGQDVEEAKQEDGQDAAPVQFTMQPWMDTKLPIKPTRPNIGRWQQVFRQVVLRNVSISTKPVQTSVPVTIPGDLIPSLSDPSLYPELVASFVMLPPSFETSPLLKQHETHWTTVKSTASRNPGNWRLPPSWIPFNQSDAETEGSPFTEFFSWAATTDDLLHKRGRTNMSDPASVALDVLTRSWVTSARDYAVYNVTNFVFEMNKQQEFLRGACSGGLERGSPACWRKFGTSGHFEHLLRMDKKTGAAEDDEEDSKPNKDTRYWYAPFLLADLSSASMKDFVPLPVRNVSDESAPKDFTFDYSITFSTSSLKKLAFLSDFHKPVMLETAKTMPDRVEFSAYDIANHHDSVEFWNALRGHHFEPGTRPIVRGAMETIASLLSFAYEPLALYFWMTRSLTTGISMPSCVIDASFDVVFSIIFGFRSFRSANLPLFMVLFELGWVVFRLAWVANLALRLEWTWGGPWGWVPVAVVRRRATHSERASARTDAKFLWRDRLILFVVSVLIKAYFPTLPQIIAASPPSPPVSAEDIGFHVTSDSSFLARQFIPLLKPFQYALWLHLITSRLILNFRRKTYGESKIIAYLLFVAAVLDRAPIVLHRLLGRAQLMDSLTVAGTVSFALKSAMAYQAFLYPAVPQEEAEDE